jgi:hypothetical protein
MGDPATAGDLHGPMDSRNRRNHRRLLKATAAPAETVRVSQPGWMRLSGIWGDFAGFWIGGLVGGSRVTPPPCLRMLEPVALAVQFQNMDMVREWSRPGQGFLTETPQARRGVRIRLDFCRKGRIAMCVGRWIWLPAGALRARPAICGALGRATSIPTPRTNGVQTHVVPFHREVP